MMVHKQTGGKYASFHSFGFTLAEILIVLGILGVIASLTIPSVINSIGQLEMKTALKKNYELISHAAAYIVKDNYESMVNACSTDSDHGCFGSLFKPYLKMFKSCPAGGTDTSCWHAANAWWYLDGSPRAINLSDRENMIMSDGALMSFTMENSNCEYTPNAQFKTTQLCGYVLIDTNGFKKPNIIGKDIFDFIILPNSVVPFGAPSIMENAYIGNSCSGSGDISWSCTYFNLYN